MIRHINALAKRLNKETGKTLIGVRVFDNCLLCYFDKNSCRFISKEGFNWGPIGSFYIPTTTYSKNKMTHRIQKQFPNVVKWVDKYVNSDLITRSIMFLSRDNNYGY